MVEKKVCRISVRVPQSWVKTLKERNIPISHTCRSALYQQLNQSDPVLQNTGKLRSKQRAASLYHALTPVRVRTIDGNLAQNLTVHTVKLPLFRSILMKTCDPGELSVLAEFLDQGEYAEELLQDAFI